MGTADSLIGIDTGKGAEVGVDAATQAMVRISGEFVAGWVVEVSDVVPPVWRVHQSGESTARVLLPACALVRTRTTWHERGVVQVRTDHAALATYRNPRAEPIDLEIGDMPGHPPDVYHCDPGATITGPAAYREAFERAGLRVNA